MHIGFDVDNTLFDLSSAAHRVHTMSRPPSKHVALEMFQTWNAASALEMSNTEFFQLLDYTWGRWREVIKLMESDAAQSIDEIRRMGHTIHIISNRTRPTHQYVAEALIDEGIPYDVLTLIDMGKIEKLEFPIDVLIDDHPNLVQRASDHPYKMVLLYTQPWNEGLLETPDGPPIPGNIRRVRSLHEATDEIHRMTRG